MPLNKLIKKLSRWNFSKADEADMRAYVMTELKKIKDTHIIKVITK